MVYGLKTGKKVSKEDIDKALGDLKFSGTLPKADGFSLQVLSCASPDTTKLYRRGVVSVKRLKKDFDFLQANLSELHEKSRGELYREIGTGVSEETEEPRKHALLAAAESVEEEPYKDFEKNIEEIVKERWRYLVMQFGGVFLTEIRPSRCFIGNKKLADMLITEGYGLNLQLLENYLKENSNGFVQVHFSDIMFNPKIKDYDIFSITSGSKRKANIFLDLAKFLSVYNKGKETIIPVHLPYYEKWKTTQKFRKFGSLDEDGERDALFKAEKVLRYLSGKWPNKNVKLALETGNGKSKRNGQIAYALLYDPFYFQTLMKGRKSFISICEDVGHLNLETVETNWKDYLTEEISEFHVSGNNGKEDEHTIATPSTLKNYYEIMSFLKFYTGNICAEIGKGKLTADEFLKGVKNLAYLLFSEQTEQDFENLRKIETYVKMTHSAKISDKNLNYERYGKYKEYT